MNAQEATATLRSYLAGERADVTTVMRAPPAGVDDALYADVARAMLDGRVFWFARSCQRLPVGAIRKLLATPAVDATTHLFLRLAVDDAPDRELAARWKHALLALLDLDLSYAWGSAQRRERFRMLAADPVILHAIQGTVAHRDEVRLDMLAVLVADGSDTSYDALVGHIGRAFAARDRRLDLLRRLHTHAVRTPALDALFADIDEALVERNAASPALALGPIIGVGELTTLWFRASLYSREINRNRVPLIQGGVRVDSRSDAWFSVYITRATGELRSDGTSFNCERVDRDDLGLGRCEPRDLPRWLVEVSHRLAIAWNAHAVSSSNLRGPKRARVEAWLRGQP